MSEKATTASRWSPRAEPGPRDYVLNLFGLFVRDSGGWIGVADLLTLLGSLGVGDAPGRSALSRMKRQGELEPASTGSARGYRLTEPAEQWFADGTERIMKGTQPSKEDQWVLAAFRVPEGDRKIRYRIRTRLQGLGFGQMSGGLMIAPASILDETARELERAELAAYVDLWQSQHVGFTPLDQVIASAWDLPFIATCYREYLDLAATVTSASNDDDEATFIRYVRHVHAWRELPFIDPGLPDTHLPQGWPAKEARATFEQISIQLRPGALRHFERIAVTDND